MCLHTCTAVARLTLGLAKLSCFFGGAEFLKSIYKIQPVFDHVAKFQGDRSRDLGESMAKQRNTKNITGSSGRPNNEKLRTISDRLPDSQFASVLVACGKYSNLLTPNSEAFISAPNT